MSIVAAFVLPFGEPREAFFPDSLLAILCARMQRAGHRAEVIRVYYDGHDPDRDHRVADALARRLGELAVDLVVVDRLFDATPIAQHVGGAPGRACVFVSRGDSFDPIDGVDYAIGVRPALARGGATRRVPTVHELIAAFDGFVERFARGEAPDRGPGVSRVREGRISHGPALPPGVSLLPFEATVAHHVISLDPPPTVRCKTIFGNAGCPYAASYDDNAFFSGAQIPDTEAITRRGCAFCCMGGDYQKRSDAEVVRETVEQALFYAEHAPDTRELLLSDQYALRYIEEAVHTAAARGARPMTWLFAARADAFVRESDRVERAIAAADETGHRVEVYLSGFEAFSDVELARYNKGTTVSELLEAVARMRVLAAAHPNAFGYREARGHSLILWNPWTTPEDLGTSLEVIRRHGLRELFDELARNRLRLYEDLPLYYAAKRDGALVEHWEGGDSGSGRRKGYNVEHPWRFLDGRTRALYALAEALRERLGTETELGQLRAAVDTVDDVGEQPSLESTTAAIDALDSELRRARAGTRAAVVQFAGKCNNGCGACANADTWLDDEPLALLARIDAARAQALPIVLAGREPTMHPSFVECVRRGAGPDRRVVGVVTNGRMFALSGVARTAERAGLRSASVKVFAPTAVVADRLSRSPGSFAQALAGIDALRTAGVGNIEIRAPLHRENVIDFVDYAALAAARGVRAVHVEAALDALGLASLEEAAHAVRALSAACGARGIAMSATPLRSGSRGFDSLRISGHARRPDR